MQKKTFEIIENNNQRVDVYLSSALDLTRSHVKKLCDDGFVVINDIISKSNKILKRGDVVIVTLPGIKNLDIEPENIPIEIIY
ncbi:MAG: RluA family pseudouridine synthase, partial [Clostridia bacterium]|nr:RluA family pseudouridine synthase [Clostridia bacterium]